MGVYNRTMPSTTRPLPWPRRLAVLSLLLAGACSDPVPSGAADTGAPGDSGARPDGAAAACPIFPADNPWNTDISGYKVHKLSAAIIAR